MKAIESQINEGKFDEAIQTMNKVIELDLLKHQKLHALKFMIWRKKQALSHNSEWWTEKEIAKDEANKLFDEFLQMYEATYGKKFDRYSPFRRTYHFENWKAFMKWDFINIRNIENE